MDRFGSFQTAGEVVFDIGHVREVLRARKASGGPEDFRLKVFAPSPILSASSEAAQLLVENFLVAAELQERIVAGGGTRWAPILECGPLPSEAGISGGFYVTPAYSSSLQILVTTRGVPALALHQVVEGTLEGLAELWKAAGRAHGNLKPSNVLLSTAQRGGFEVFLTDPAGTAAQGSVQAAGADLRSLSRSIHDLVRENDALGRSRQAWLDFCESLEGSAEAAAGGTPYDVALLHLKKLHPQKRGSKKWLVVGAGVVGAGLLLVTTFTVLQQKGGEADVETYWREALEAYEWVQLTEDDDRLERWQSHGLLDEAIVQPASHWKARGLVVNPAKTIGTSGEISYFQELKEVPKGVYDNASELRDLFEHIESIERGIQRIWDTGSPFRAELAAAAAKLEERGFKEAAVEVRDGLLPSIQAGRELEAIAAIDRCLDVLGQVAEIEKEWANPVLNKNDVAKNLGLNALVESLQDLTGTRGRLLKVAEEQFVDVRKIFTRAKDAEVDRLIIRGEEGFDRGVRGLRDIIDRGAGRWDKLESAWANLAATEDPLLSVLGKHYAARIESATSWELVDTVLSDAERVSTFWTGFVDTNWAKVDHQLARQEISLSGDVASDLSRLEIELPKYIRLAAGEDPRRNSDWDKLEESVERLMAAGTFPEREKITQEIERLKQVEIDLRNEAGIRKNAEKIRMAQSQLDQQVGALSDQLAQLELERLNPEPWLRSLESFQLPESAALNGAWATLHKERTSGITAQVLKNDPERYRNLRNHFQQIQNNLEWLVESDFLSGASLSEVELGSLRDPLEKWIAEERERVFERLVVLDLALPVADFREAAENLSEVTLFREGVADLARCATDLVQVTARMGTPAAYQVLDDDLKATHERFRNSNKVQEVLRLATTDLNEKALLLAEMRAVSELESVSMLLAKLQEEAHPSVRLTAWHNLRDLPSASFTFAEFNQMISLSGGLIEQLSGEGKDAVDRERGARWIEFVNQAPVEAMDELFLQDNLPEVSSELLLHHVRFNRLLVKARADLAARRPLADILISFIGGLPAEEKEAVDELRTIQAMLSETAGPPAEVEDCGPAVAGWQTDQREWTPRMKYSWTAGNRTFNLDFLELKNEETGALSYLSATEFPVEVFVEWLRNHGPLPSVTEGDIPRPQTWSLDSGEPEVGLDLLSGIDPQPRWKDTWEMYSAKRGVDPRHPVQQISAIGARDFAASLGCRLPTPEEWEAALKIADDSVNRGNLRRQEWREYVQDLDRIGVPRSARGAQKAPQSYPETTAFATLLNLSTSDATYDGSDDSIWFRPVPEAENGFADLIGNVAEFLQQEGAYFIVGGSAFSPPELGELETTPLDSNRQEQRFSDVGFRLAFTVSASQPGKKEFQEWLDRQQFRAPPVSGRVVDL